MHDCVVLITINTQYEWNIHRHAWLLNIQIYVGRASTMQTVKNNNTSSYHTHNRSTKITSCIMTEGSEDYASTFLNWRTSGDTAPQCLKFKFSKLSWKFSYS